MWMLLPINVCHAILRVMAAQGQVIIYVNPAELAFIMFQESVNRDALLLQYHYQIIHVVVHPNVPNVRLYPLNV